MSKLTVGIPCYDDYDGVFFTIQSLRMHHAEVMGSVDLLVVDNNHGSERGQAVKGLCERAKARYVPLPDVSGPAATKDQVFALAETEWVLCLDCHVLLWPGALVALIDYFKSGADQGNLLQGPLIYDDLHHISTHFDPVWRGHMLGIWATDQRGVDLHAEPFEIPAQGMGLFACHKAAWLGFNPRFRGFGGEEVYIHEKFRQAGRKTMCLPFLRWLHRFDRPDGVKYPLKLDDRVHNYLMGHLELGLDPTPMADHFKKELGEEGWAAMWERLRPEFTPPRKCPETS